MAIFERVTCAIHRPTSPKPVALLVTRLRIALSRGLTPRWIGIEKTWPDVGPAPPPGVFFVNNTALVLGEISLVRVKRLAKVFLWVGLGQAAAALGGLAGVSFLTRA